MTVATIDRDDEQRALDRLADRHGSLAISAPDPSTGSVTITGADGYQYRFTTQSRLIATGPIKTRS